MTITFDSIEDAKEYVAYITGSDPKIFEKVEGLKVAGMEAFLLDDPETSEEIKQSIRDKIDAQQAFKFTNAKGVEVSIVIGPFRDGFDCWIVGDKGTAVRL
ncbi:MAG: hypothetical protein NTY33_03640 [Candidatus Moranbacteria bacterium]|nr:hypothetical protein [Candidatus Moranbacteria bacterium]